MTCSGRVTASLLFCSSQWLSFKACFITLHEAGGSPGIAQRATLHPPQVEGHIPSATQVLQLSSCVETGGVLEGRGPADFPSPPALSSLRVRQWHILLDFSSSQRSWQQPGFSNRDSKALLPKSQLGSNTVLQVGSTEHKSHPLGKGPEKFLLTHTLLEWGRDGQE